MDSSSQREGATIAQINVTPLVDVMLVLLVIFMVTTPIIQQSVQVNLPQGKAAAIPGTGLGRGGVIAGGCVSGACCCQQTGQQQEV